MRALIVASPIALFLLFFHVEILDPTRIGWLLDEDWGQHVLGWHAFRNVPWAWPFNYQDLLAHPTGLSIIYTDSNPLFSFFFKIFKDILPENFQFIGPWFGLCVVLQFVFAWKLVRPHAPNPYAALAAAIILCLLPAMYHRLRHDTLVAHFFILWTLWIFFNVRDEKHKTYWYAAALGTAGFIHPYLLFMMMAVWGADVLRRLVPIRREALWPVLRDAGLVLLAPVITLGLSGAYSGNSADAFGYGYFSMGLDAPINPVEPEFSFFLKAHPQDRGQAFEGFQYMGLGLLGLLLGALLLYQTSFSARTARPFIESARPLILPFVCLFLIALSHQVQFYDMVLFKLPLPEKILDLLGVLRASGRLFWPIAYTLVLIALVVVLKSRPRMRRVALPAIIIVQLIDLQGFIPAIRAQTALARSDVIYDQTPSPVWDELITASKGVNFYPPQVHLNDQLFYEITWRSVSQKKPVNTMYAARDNRQQRLIELKGREAYLDGKIDDERLYVFLNQCHAPENLQPLMREIDGVWLIPPASARGMDLPEPQWKPVRARLDFGFLNQGSCLLDRNWTAPEVDGSWTLGERAQLVIPIQDVQFPGDTRPEKPYLRLLAKSFYRPRTVDVLINDRKVESLELRPESASYDIALPASVFRRHTLTVTFVVHEPVSLKALGASDDDRPLGMKLFRASIEDAAAD